MTFPQLLIVMVVLTVLLSLGVLRRTRAAKTSREQPSALVIALWLAVLAGALLAVGVVSHTLVRHCVQIAPLVLALGLLAGRPAWGVSAAAPLFAFWLLLMGVIWLFLLDVVRLISGTFTPVETLLTVIIGVACLLGLTTTFRRGTTLTLLATLGTVALFAMLQLAAMWLSMQPYLARR